MLQLFLLLVLWLEKTEITVEKTVEKKKIDKNNENEIPQEEGN